MAGLGRGDTVGDTSTTRPAGAQALPAADLPSLVAGQEHLAGSLVISNAKTVGRAPVVGATNPCASRGAVNSLYR